MTAKSYRHFLDIRDLSRADLRAILDDAKAMKAARKGLRKGAPDPAPALPGCALAMIFEKPSTRTRVSFDIGIRQLGGSAVLLSSTESQLGRGESISDTAEVLSRYVDAIMIRTGEHAGLLELAARASVPVINGLTDDSHPCQIVADILTIEERFGPVEERRLVWVGDGNNMATSFIEAAAVLGFELTLACPEPLSPNERALAFAAEKGAKVKVERSPEAAVAGADAVITDTWFSMGDEPSTREARHNMLAAYQVTDDLMAKAGPGAIFMHCLPAHRGEEATAEVMDGAQSAIFDEAENRLHAQKAIIKWCLMV